MPQLRAKPLPPNPVLLSLCPHFHICVSPCAALSCHAASCAVPVQLAGVRMRVVSLEGELNQGKALQEAVDKDLARVRAELAAVSHTGLGWCWVLQ